jgi:CPA2 family monovalent cation:H+ antiporter-2
MQRMTSLDVALLYLLAAVLAVVLFRLLKLPAMLGYLVAGIVLGPHALALAGDAERVSYLAEFGVVFLMFVIGLEFNLPKLRSMQHLVFGLGLGQVMLTLLGTLLGHMAISVVVAWFGQSWNLSWQAAITLGAALAMSSTAIVAKLLAERLELSAEHGQRVMGVLLFQDLAVVPLLVLVPALAAPADADLLITLGVALFKGAVLVGALLWGGPRVMRSWLTVVARRKSDELFMLNLLLITLGLSWLTEHAGLSMALGAFLAGMLIAETEYKHVVETDIRPFHDVLLGLFFITIGMKLDWWSVWQHWWLVLLLTIVPVLAKALLVTVLARIMGATPGVSLRTGLYLAQAGEFGFVLLSLGAQHALIAPEWLSPVLAAMVLSMLATPFMVEFSDRIVLKVVANEWMMQSVQLTNIATRAIRSQSHVIICGYGRSGQQLARLLGQEHIPYMALDLDPDRVRQAAAAGHSVVFGDAARLPSLMAAGLARAAAVVVSYHDTPSALRVLAHVREHAPQVPVIVRTPDERDLDVLRQAGAAEVVPETVEGTLMLAGHALALVGVPMRRVLRVVQTQREARYQLLRGYFHGWDDDTLEDMEQERLLSVTLPLGAFAVGRTLDELALHALHVEVLQWRADNGTTTHEIDERHPLEGGDTLVLFGRPAPLEMAHEKLLKG